MKILFITHFFPPRHNAGTENYTFGLAKEAIRLGHAVEVLCAEDWQQGDGYWNGIHRDDYQDIPVNRINLNWQKANNPNLVLYQSETVNHWLRKYLQESSFDLVHVTSTYSLGVGILQEVRAAGIPLVLTLMDFWFLCPSVQLLRSDGAVCDGKTTPLECNACLMASSGLANRIGKSGNIQFFHHSFWHQLALLPRLSTSRWFRGKLMDMQERKRLLLETLQLPDVVLTHSAFVKEMFARHSSVNVRVIKNGHEMSWLEKYDGKVHSEVLRVGYIGQLVPVKGVHVLIEAFLKSDYKDQANLTLWGDLNKDPDFVNSLRSLSAGNPAINFAGRYERENLAKVLAEIDVLVVPSTWYENAPLVIQEAFATQTPVIATNLGGMAEAVKHQISGLLFEYRNSDDLADRLNMVINNPATLNRLVEGIPSVKYVREEFHELEEIYTALLQAVS